MSASEERKLANELRLRGSLAPVTRLSRRALVILAVSLGIALALVVGWTLGPRSHSSPVPAEPATPSSPSAQLGLLPKDYASGAPDAPKLGPPLPGDLGRPLMEANLPPPPPLPPMSAANVREGSASAPVDPVASSRLFIVAAVRPAEPQTLAPAPPETQAAAAPIVAPQQASPGERRLAFLSSGAGPAGKIEASASPYLLQAGSVVPAALVTGIRSDLPGPVAAQVTEDVYDSVAERYVLIPQGARLLGTYDAQVAFGQQRVLVVWTRLILPDGRSVDLGREPAADVQGYAGLSDQVDRKWKELGASAAVSTLLGIGSQLGAGNGDSQIVQALRNGTSNALNQAGQQIVGKSLDVQPTLTIRPGFPVRLLLTHDLVLAPWSPATDGAEVERAAAESGSDGE